jgi:hypothetical protein
VCDYCGCRSVELIDRLGQEHADLLLQGSTIRRQTLIGDLAEARTSLAQLVADLGRHTRTEEGALFPVMRYAGMEETAAELDGEHRALEHLVREAAIADDAAWPSIAIELLAILSAHVRREEYDVFPAAAQLVPPARWDAAHEKARALTA